MMLRTTARRRMWVGEKENESGSKSKEEVAELYEFPDKDFWYKFIKQERIIRANALKKPKDERWKYINRQFHSMLSCVNGISSFGSIPL